eukprot:scaffold241565_cov14-Tisochrysis_lutea.AAC.1
MLLRERCRNMEDWMLRLLSHASSPDVWCVTVASMVGNVMMRPSTGSEEPNAPQSATTSISDLEVDYPHILDVNAKASGHTSSNVFKVQRQSYSTWESALLRGMRLALRAGS